MNTTAYQAIAAMELHGGPQARALAALWMATHDPIEQQHIMSTWGHVFEKFSKVSEFLEWKNDPRT